MELMKTPPVEAKRDAALPRTLREVFRAFWPPLPVWRRLDATVATVAGYSGVAVVIYHSFGVHIPEWGHGSTILNALVLGVLLAFRNKEAYDRWWEGRKLWGQLVNDSRNLTLKAAALGKLSADGRRELARLVAGFAVALKDRLRDEAKLQKVPGFEADPADPPHVPNHVAGRVFAVLQAERAAGRLTDVDVLTLDPHARALMDVCGACERIKSSPIPLSYRSLLRHGLVLYLLTTPWLLADDLGWGTLPVMALLSYFLLGIELTAEDVEEPFGHDGDDLTLNRYCDTIRQGVEQALGK